MCTFSEHNDIAIRCADTGASKQNKHLNMNEKLHLLEVFLRHYNNVFTRFTLHFLAFADFFHYFLLSYHIQLDKTLLSCFSLTVFRQNL